MGGEAGHVEAAERQWKCLEVRRSAALTAEPGVPGTSPNTTACHRCCQGPVVKVTGCYDRNQTERGDQNCIHAVSRSSGGQTSKTKGLTGLCSPAGFKRGSFRPLSASGGHWHSLVYAHIILVFAWSSWGFLYVYVSSSVSYKDIFH